jgi:CheY-like chemotaxis protein
MNETETKEPQLAAGPVPETQSTDWRAKAMRSDRLLVRMNHEIRTAVNVIVGLTDIIRESALNPGQCANVSVARASAEHLLQQSTEIIDLTRAELGSLRLASGTFNLPETLRQAMDLMSILASCKRIAIKFHISKEMPIAVSGDAGRLRQILLTLVRGSIDRLEQGEVSVTAEHDANNPFKIKFCVTDNGRFISPENINRMVGGDLDQESAMRPAFALPLVRHLARMMGGDLWAEDQRQVGTAFHFTVHLSPAPAEQSPRLYRPESTEYTDGRPLKILVADDSADTLMVIRAYLKDAPWGIESAENGKAALDMAVSKAYDLILMDLDMPEMDGYAATRQIRISECLRGVPAVPIVALTAHNEAEAASQSIQSGCTAHVTKPIRKAALIDTIQRYAGDRRSAVA